MTRTKKLGACLRRLLGKAEPCSALTHIGPSASTALSPSCFQPALKTLGVKHAISTRAWYVALPLIILRSVTDAQARMVVDRNPWTKVTILSNKALIWMDSLAFSIQEAINAHSDDEDTRLKLAELKTYKDDDLKFSMQFAGGVKFLKHMETVDEFKAFLEEKVQPLVEFMETLGESAEIREVRKHFDGLVPAVMDWITLRSAQDAERAAKKGASEAAARAARKAQRDAADARWKAIHEASKALRNRRT